jgi:putative DNA primase/helicase
MNIRNMARTLGGQIAGRNILLCPGPGHSRSDRSLQVTLQSGAPDGFLVHSFCGDDWRDCRDHVRARLGLPSWEPGDGQNRRVIGSVRELDQRALDAQAEERPHTQDDRKRIECARAIWDEARNLRGTLAESYLQLRKIFPLDDEALTALRFHPRCPWRNENTGQTDRVPALIAAFRSIDDDKITAVHRVALTADAHKIGRRMLGIVQGAAIKLDHDVGDEIAVGEGIETCLAARLLGIRSVWALGSVGMISTFPVLPNVTTLRLIAENDKASADAIDYCGTRWQRAGRRVRVIKPTFDAKDLNDALGAHAYDGTGR